MMANRVISHIPPYEGTSLRTAGGLASVKIEAAETNGAYAVMVVHVQPQGGPPAVYSHPFVKSFYVVSGTFEFTTVGKTGVEAIRPSVGAFIHVPGNAPHSFKNVGTEVGTLIVIGEPDLVAFLREMADVVTADGAFDRSKAEPVLAKYKVRFAVPVGA